MPLVITNLAVGHIDTHIQHFEDKLEIRCAPATGQRAPVLKQYHP